VSRAVGTAEGAERPLRGTPAEGEASSSTRFGSVPALAVPDFDPDQLDGRYFYAGDPSQLAATFLAVRDQIVRSSQ